MLVFFFNKNKRILLIPYVRLKLSSGKFSDKKYTEDKESVLDYYNSQGYRDVVIVGDTAIYDVKNNLNLFLKVNEGRKYYFGDIAGKEIQNILILF